jgi:hypothetical protein
LRLCGHVSDIVWYERATRLFEEDFVRAPNAVLDHIFLFRVLSHYLHAPTTLQLRQYYHIPESQSILDEAYKGVDLCCAAFGVSPPVNTSRDRYLHPIIAQLQERRKLESIEGRSYTYKLEPRTLEIILRLLHRLDIMDM